jgi:hypothetical protein
VLAARTGIIRYLSRPDLAPARIAVTRTGSAAAPGDPRYILLATKGPDGRPGTGQSGLMLLDRRGDVVWFRPVPGRVPQNLQVQSYRGRPVLTWWAGRVTDGVGAGTCYIAGPDYEIIATVRAGRGLTADLHEFTITAAGTALITAYRQRPANLSAARGPRRGRVFSGVVQEIDIATGKVIFEWDSLDHVPVGQTRVTPGAGPLDYFHVNSVAVAPDGDLLISARNTCAVYKVARRTGAVRWQLGGKASDFHFGPGATFYFQHHVRPVGGAGLSIFDNGAPPAERQSRAIVIDLNMRAMRATLRRAYPSPMRTLSLTQGSVQVLSSGRVFVGWGAEPSFSEYTAAGTESLDGRLPAGDESYRAFTADWIGAPRDRPVVTARPARGGSSVYVSWNGATEVAAWTVLAGSHGSALRPVARQQKAGFETMIPVRTSGPYFAVAAIGARGQVIGTSAVVRRTAR